MKETALWHKSAFFVNTLVKLPFDERRNGVYKKKGRGENAVRTLTEVVVLLTLLGTYIGISLLVYKRKRTNPFFYSIYFYLATSVILICLVIFWLQLRFGLTDKQVGGLLISVVAFFLLIYGLLKTKQKDR